MKITKERIKQIIREEIQLVIEKGFIDTAVATVANKGIDKVKSGFKSGDRGGSNVKGLGVCDPYVKHNIIIGDPKDSVDQVMIYDGPDGNLEDECWHALDKSLENYYDIKGTGFFGKRKAKKDRKKVRKALKKAKFDKTYQKAWENEKAGKTGRATQIFVKDSTGSEIKDLKSWISKIIA
jgi:hypothetical protein